MTKFISWNVNGLRACNGKGFSEAFKALDADFFCLQETKMQAGQLDLQFEGYKSYWSYADKKGYSGTAIYTRHEPLAVSYGLGIDEHDHEGRVITLEMPEYFVVTAYVPNSQDGLRRLDYRMKWDEDFRNYLMELRKKKPVIACGDFNVAHQEIDLKIRSPTAAMRASPMKNASNFPTSSMRASPTLSASSTPTKRASTLGGPTVSRRERKTLDGALTISSCRTISTTNWPMPKSIRKSSAQTIARSKWH